jgi:hypothetical protein
MCVYECVCVCVSLCKERKKESERVGDIVRNLEAANQDVAKEVMELISQKSVCVNVCKEREGGRESQRHRPELGGRQSGCYQRVYGTGYMCV